MMSQLMNSVKSQVSFCASGARPQQVYFWDCHPVTNASVCSPGRKWSCATQFRCADNPAALSAPSPAPVLPSAASPAPSSAPPPAPQPVAKIVAPPPAAAPPRVPSPPATPPVVANAANAAAAQKISAIQVALASRLVETADVLSASSGKVGSAADQMTETMSKQQFKGCRHLPEKLRSCARYSCKSLSDLLPQAAILGPNKGGACVFIQGRKDRKAMYCELSAAGRDFLVNYYTGMVKGKTLLRKEVSSAGKTHYEYLIGQQPIAGAFPTETGECNAP